MLLDIHILRKTDFYFIFIQLLFIMNYHPTISISRPFNVKDEKNDSLSDVTWKSAVLNVDDNISWGATRCVEIEYYQDSEYTYLKTVKRLNKTEFEELFDFKPNEFIKGRIIRILSEKIQIQPPLIRQEPFSTLVKSAQSPKSEGGGGGGET